MIDDFLLFINQYGIYFILIVSVIKVIILLWYKPNRPKYAFNNFFNYYGKYAIRDEQLERWVKFKRLHNPATLIFYILTGLLLLTIFIFKFVATSR